MVRPQSYDFLNDISESNDKVLTGDDSKNQDSALSDTENNSSEQNDNSGDTSRNQSNNQKKLDSNNSDSTGDPVRITEGVYEQNETDLLFGNIISEGIKRKYRSDNKIISSFGYGWT